jgi:hypothetical protein
MTVKLLVPTHQQRSCYTPSFVSPGYMRPWCDRSSSELKVQIQPHASRAGNFANKNNVQPHSQSSKPEVVSVTSTCLLLDTAVLHSHIRREVLLVLLYRHVGRL